MNTSQLEISGTLVKVHHIPLLERMRVWMRNWHNRGTAKAFRTLEKAMRDDPDYAHSWKANLAMAVYDDTRNGEESTDPLTCRDMPIAQCNGIADRIMQQFFNVDTKEGK